MSNVMAPQIKYEACNSDLVQAPIHHLETGGGEHAIIALAVSKLDHVGFMPPPKGFRLFFFHRHWHIAVLCNYISGFSCYAWVMGYA